jgi:hypothetical protein
VTIGSHSHENTAEVQIGGLLEDREPATAPVREIRIDRNGVVDLDAQFAAAARSGAQTDRSLCLPRLAMRPVSLAADL